MRAIQITEFGGPEVLRLTELDEPTAATGQHRIAVARAGLNYADTHQTEDSYLTPTRLPLVPGAEVAGTDEDGRRVVAIVGTGGYAEVAVGAQALTFEVPEGIGDGTALALLLQGTTAWHLLRTCAHLQRGESVVVHAGAGGVGTLAVQLARAWGAGRVIASASTEDKRKLALDLGADIAVDSTEPDMKAALEDANAGAKVDIVLEMAGGSVFDASLAALAPFGRIVTYGMASRSAPKPVHAGELMRRGRAVVGFWLAHCFSQPSLMAKPLDQLFGMVRDGDLRAVIGGTYPLNEAPLAHEELRARRTTGKLLLDPSA